MKLTFDARYNIADIALRDKAADVQSIKFGEELVMDIAPDGTLYGIELLNANEQLHRDKSGQFQFVNEQTGKHIEITLPV